MFIKQVNIQSKKARYYYYFYNFINIFIMINKYYHGPINHVL